jgi:hypothetical protein
MKICLEKMYLEKQDLVYRDEASSKDKSLCGQKIRTAGTTTNVKKPLQVLFSKY